MGGWGEGEDCRGDEWEGGGRGRIAGKAEEREEMRDKEHGVGVRERCGFKDKGEGRVRERRGWVKGKGRVGEGRGRREGG